MVQEISYMHHKNNFCEEFIHVSMYILRSMTPMGYQLQAIIFLWTIGTYCIYMYSQSFSIYVSQIIFDYESQSLTTHVPRSWTSHCVSEQTAHMTRMLTNICVPYISWSMTVHGAKVDPYGFQRLTTYIPMYFKTNQYKWRLHIMNMISYLI